MAWRRQQPEFDSLASLGFGDESADQYDALAQAGPVYDMGQQAAPSERISLGEDVIHTEQGQSFYVHRYSDGSYVPLTPAEVNTRLEVVGGLPPLEQSQTDGSTTERKVPTEVKIETGITFWFNTNGHPEYVPDAQQALTRQIEGLSSLTQRQAAELVRNGSQGQEQWYQDQPPQGASYSGPTFDNSGYRRVLAEELPQNYNWASDEQVGPAVEPGRVGQTRDEAPINDQPNPQLSKKELRQLKAEQRKQKAEQRGPARKVGIMLAVGGIAAGAFFVGLDKSTTAVYQFVAGNTSSPLWSTKGKHDVERFPLIGPLLSYPVPNIHGGSVNGDASK